MNVCAQRHERTFQPLPSCHNRWPAPARRQEQTSRRICKEEFNYVDKKTGQCQECPLLMWPVLIFLAYASAVALVFFLLYKLLRKSWRVLKRSAQATRWVAAVHARSFGQQGPAKFRVSHASCNIKKDCIIKKLTSLLHWLPYILQCYLGAGGTGVLSSVALTRPHI